MQDLISHQLVKYLEDRGVEHIFGLCGHTNIAVLTALEKSSIKFINTRHEQVAAHAADGYARAKKTTAVVLSHLGPGLTNAATGVANAALDSIPVLVVRSVVGMLAQLVQASSRIAGYPTCSLDLCRGRRW
jgi:acetolactate synthase-1/2/3 large subunit